jgi:hypothetical protein
VTVNPRNYNVPHHWSGRLIAATDFTRYATIEKNNGLWYEASSEEYVFEEYAEDLDLIAAVRKTNLGHFVAVLFQKVADHQYLLPFWSEVRPEALFDNQQGAVRHVLTFLDNQRRKAHIG